MAVYDNFLNTPFELKNTIVLGTLANYVETSPPDKAFIVYCEPKTFAFNKILTLLEYNSFDITSKFRQNMSFRNQTIFGKKLNLFLVFNNLKHQLHKASVLTPAADAITIQKYFYPYYQNLYHKTTYANLITLSDFLTQLNIMYGYERIMHNDVSKLVLEEDEDEELNLVVNYDLYCPYYDYPIRFVFQHHVKIPKKNPELIYDCPVERLEATGTQLSSA